jgi:pimeloyl-ACP methyl ester carboxylesterase
MSTLTLKRMLAAVLLFATSLATTAAPKTDIGFVDVGGDITLRRMVVRNRAPQGTVLLLHGFPETLYAWRGIAQALGEDYEVHAFDWPGFGQSSRPSADKFAYAPSDYARVLGQYIDKAHLDSSTLTIYATDIGALPALLLALERPGIARTIIVGDFAPFDRPAHMYESLQGLKTPATAEQIRIRMNIDRDEILQNAFRRGLPESAQFEVSREFKDDMARGWDHGGMTSADAFFHYYSHFTRDQKFFEANVARLRTSTKVIWGELDLYIRKDMGVEFATRTHAEFSLLPGVGHYPHQQKPEQAIAEIRASFRREPSRPH